jgi:hypothetical protein
MSPYISVWLSPTVQILYTSCTDPTHIFHIFCNQFTVFIVNDVSTLLLFKFAMEAVSSLQERQESISLMTPLSRYGPDWHALCAVRAAPHQKKNRNKRWGVYSDPQHVHLTTALLLASMQTPKVCDADIYHMTAGSACLLSDITIAHRRNRLPLQGG